MHENQQPYRALVEALFDGGAASAAELVFSWLERNPAEQDWLGTFALRSRPDAGVGIEDLWRLYGVSRVLQLLILSFQSGQADGSAWAGPAITQSELTSFARQLGLTVLVPTRFSAFECEIVEAEQTLALDAPVALRQQHWPCLMLGELLIQRAGVSVSGGAGQFNAAVAGSSTLYWAYRRKTRPYQDLSHGWGGNSQWRTRFRRDYRVGTQLHYNVDGEHSLAAASVLDRDGLTREERSELLTHRCFIRTTKPSDDLWPYDDQLTLEEANAG